MFEQIREVVAKHGGVTVDPASLEDSTDLYEAGMTSFASVDLMLGLEEAFNIEFPDALLTRQTFASISSIAEALSKLIARAA
ncbi:MAG: acyl carrier protein [Phenylobacterium zucineum]|nr:MAG: acyl carrier protein [Phenylobacterium zucineum]